MKLRAAPAAMLLLSACTVGPDYRGAPPAAPVAAARGAFLRATDGATAEPGLARWWESLGDPTLTALVDMALENSPTIAVAEARVRQARADLSAKQASHRPSVGANATYLHARLPGTSIGQGEGGQDGGQGGGESDLDFYNVGATASWELDLAGGQRRSSEQARATLEQRDADRADAQVSLTAQVAQAYVNLRDSERRSRLTVRQIAIEEQQLALTEQRYTAGTATALDVDKVQQALRNSRSQAAPLIAAIEEYRDQLALLTGQEPGALDAMLAAPAMTPLPPAQAKVGDPAALIARRPDIRAAERALAASTAGIGINRAKLYPSLRFVGILGIGGTSPGDVFDPDSLTVLAAPMLSWTFLDFGKTRAAIRGAEAGRDAAEADYRRTLLAALQDAETSLSRFAGERRRLGELVRAEESASHAAALNARRVEAGTSSRLEQLDMERRRIDAGLSVAQATAQLTIAYIAVQKSLGLGWTEMPVG